MRTLQTHRIQLKQRLTTKRLWDNLVKLLQAVESRVDDYMSEDPLDTLIGLPCFMEAKALEHYRFVGEDDEVVYGVGSGHYLHPWSHFIFIPADVAHAYGLDDEGDCRFAPVIEDSPLSWFVTDGDLLLPIYRSDDDFFGWLLLPESDLHTLNWE